MMTNKEKASRLDEVLPGYPEDQHTNLIDLLADTMHWCFFNDVDFEEVLGIARGHFEAEVKEPA